MHADKTYKETYNSDHFHNCSGLTNTKTGALYGSLALVSVPFRDHIELRSAGASQGNSLVRMPI